MGAKAPLATEETDNNEVPDLVDNFRELPRRQQSELSQLLKRTKL